jgi:LysR family hydrogen peroxide-inducible transcriptional activator
LLSKQKIVPDDIVEDGLWLLDEGHCFRNQVLNICSKTGESESHPGILFESGSIETIKNMVRSNMGYSLIPQLSVNDELDRDLVRRFRDPQLTREVSIVTYKNFTREVLLNHLRESIMNNIPDDFKKNHYFVRVKWR